MYRELVLEDTLVQDGHSYDDGLAGLQAVWGGGLDLGYRGYSCSASIPAKPPLTPVYIGCLSSIDSIDTRVLPLSSKVQQYGNALKSFCNGFITHDFDCPFCIIRRCDDTRKMGLEIAMMKTLR